MAKQGQKLSDETKELIKVNLVMSDNINEVAKKLGVSWATVDKVKKEIKDIPEEEEKYEKLREDKKNLMIDRIWNDMELALDLGTQKILLAKAATENFEELIEKLTEALKDGGAKFNDVMEVMRQVSTVMSIPLGQISTYFGTLFDKRALMSGGKTASIDLSIVVELPDELM